MPQSYGIFYHSESVKLHFLYLPLLILASEGFSAFDGIAHEYPILITPGMRSCTQSVCTRLLDIPHFSAVCVTERYSISQSPFEAKVMW